jgi:purine-binding chemotaxis protein CheW
MVTGIKELQLAGFHLGDNLFAVDLMRIREIVTPQKVTGLPLQSSGLEGMINLRGQVIPVLNLRARFGLPPRTATQGKLIILSVAGRLVALDVDELDEVVTVPVSALSPPPEMLDELVAEYLIAVTMVNDQICLLIDIDALFAATERYSGLSDRQGGADDEL